MHTFRKGFLLHHQSAQPNLSDCPQWPHQDIGLFRLRADPATPLHRYAVGSSEVIILGDIFSISGQPLDALAAQVTEQRWSALDDFSGRFALLLVEEDSCRIANDPFGARTVFYRTDAPFAAASHANLLAGAFGIPTDAETRSFIRRREYSARLVKYLPGDRSLFQNVYALVPNNLLGSDGRTRRYWPVAPLVKASYQELLDRFEQYFAAFVRYVAQRYVPVFGITGGVDSLTTFAPFLKAGVPIEGVTWGAPYITPEELPIVEHIVSRFALPHCFLDASKAKAHGPAAKAASISCGGFRDNSRLTQEMATVYGENDKAVFVRGYGGEIIRGFYTLRNGEASGHDAGLMARLYSRRIRIKGEWDSDYLPLCTKIFEGFMQRGNYAGLEPLGYDPLDIFYWEHRMGMWGASMLNEMDPALYSMAGLNDRELYRIAFGMPAQQRLTKQLLHSVARHFEPRLAEVDRPI
jgi:hypothetical protein